MRYHYQKPDIYLSMYGELYICNHPVYDRCTLFTIGDKGLAVIQQRFSADTKSTYWAEVDSWLTDSLYLHPKFKEYFDSRSGECTDGLYPTVTIRQIMWALKMKPIQRQRWETCFDRSKRSMDEMRIVSKFTRGIISKAIKMVIRKKTGYNIDIQLNEAITTINDGKTHLHLDVDAELDKDELMSILKSIGLN